MKRISALALAAAGTVAAAAAAGTPKPKRPVAPAVDLSSMVAIPASSFMMGQASTTTAPYGDPWFLDQRPVHRVTLSGYRLDRREVTVAEFALFLTYAGGAAHFDADQPIERVRDGYLPMRGAENQPMRQVTWSAAEQYCRWAGKRLPTEAEWERAASGVERRIYPWGNEDADCRRAAFFTSTSFCEDGPPDVGARPGGATPDGILDLAGGVAEWTSDWYDAYPSDDQVDPTGPAAGTLKAVRGGGFLDGAEFLRAQARWGAPPALRSDQIGFRCALGDGDATTPVRRGVLTPPADLDRVPSQRPRVPAAPSPEVLARGLVGAGAIAELGGRWYVARGAEVVVVERGTGVVGRALEGLGAATDVATDGQTLFVTDAVKGDVWSVDPGGLPARAAAGEDSPGAVAAIDGQVAWSTKSAVRTVRAPSAPVEDLATGLDGVSALAFTSDHLVFAEAGDANTDRARIAVVPRAGGASTTVVTAAALDGLRPTALTVDAGAGRTYFMLQGRKWPNPTVACSAPLAGGAVQVHSFSPPHTSKIVVAGAEIFWTSLRAVLSVGVDGAPAYERPGIWGHSNGLFAGPTGVVWTDQHSGRVLLGR